MARYENGIKQGWYARFDNKSLGSSGGKPKPKKGYLATEIEALGQTVKPIAYKATHNPRPFLEPLKATDKRRSKKDRAWLASNFKRQQD